MIKIITNTIASIVNNSSGSGSGSRYRSDFHSIHKIKENPGRRREESVTNEIMMTGESTDALLFGTVALTELLHFMAALSGGLGRGLVGTTTVNLIGNSFPVGGAEVTTAERVPFILVSVD